MAEKIVSPGVFTNEVDQSFLPAGVANIGAAIVGPTVKGPAFVPTVVGSYSEYIQKFGNVFTSGSGATKRSYKYLTSYAVEQYLKNATSVTVVRVMGAGYAKAYSNVASSGSVTNPATYGSGSDGASFTLHTLADGTILNSGQQGASTRGTGSGADQSTNGILVSGSTDNLRWEISNVNEAKGTFTLVIRRGDDTNTSKTILETWSNLSLDPNSPSYIARRIGDQVYTLADAGTTQPYLQLSGSYPNKSAYVRVAVNKTTYNFLDNNGNVSDATYLASLPAAVSGTFAFGADGALSHPAKYFESIDSTNTQGVAATVYADAINLLANQDEYDINLLVTPGLLDDITAHATQITTALNMVQNRGDAFYVIDPVQYGSTITSATQEADDRDTSYAAMYWPWIQIPDPDLGRNVWVPASTLIPGIYAFNDRVSAEWFAPAGLNRGGIDIAIQAERKLTQNNRDTLYDANVNPIATFPGSGVVVYGQKTLQKKSSALDRINVRRLLIAAKKFVASTSRFLVFENNTAATRNRFLSIVNPYFESVQQRQGLYAFKVIMDETNNTPDVVDRNELRGAIYLQPAKTAEFIIVDFIVQPTGATFPGE